MKPLFVYGTLLFPEVVKKLIGKHVTQKAVLDNYRRIEIIERGQRLPYPALLPLAGARTEGMLLSGLTAQELLLLDEYEGEEYERTEVSVLTDTGTCKAWCYVWKANHLAVSGEDWDPEHFAANALSAWLQELPDD
ncbi:MAG: gamma-glutamylcyclotransferase [Prolixibacteraceae bacterium]|nr:gamma-glutamylcyclotransferase [Prolixibacteraceae bacterium]